METITQKAFQGVPSDQIVRLNSSDDAFELCPENLQGSSRCYGVIQWNSIDLDKKIYNYTVRNNNGLSKISVDNAKSSTDVFVLPLQWAMDRAITNLTETPLSMPYTSETNEYERMRVNTVFTNVIANWLAPVFFLGMIGVIYHLSGVVAQERELGLSNLLSSMGVNRISLFLAYHISFTLVYLIGWITIAICLQTIVFDDTNMAILIFYHILSGLSTISFTLFLGGLFKSAQMSGILSSGFSVFLALVCTVQTKATPNGQGPYKVGAIYFLSILFPPCNYTYFITGLAKFQHSTLPANLINEAPDSSIRLIVIFVSTLFQIVFYFFLAIFYETWVYKIPGPLVSSSEMVEDDSQVVVNALQIDQLSKSYNTSGILARYLKVKSKKSANRTVTAVNSLSLDVRKGQIVCLLGANGSGKTTTLEMISGIQKPSSGTITIAPQSKIGICPQKNVLWDQLTVREHLEIWAGLKGVSKSNIKEEASFYIDHCDLSIKSSVKSTNLSGGQKRKLQLAIMFIGDSNICCVDEVSSGLDPLSRRRIWDIILSKRGTTSIILTTHFLDEADLLADHIALLSKGVLRATGTSVHLKEQLGGGYRVFVTHHGSGVEDAINCADAASVIKIIDDLEKQGIEYSIAGPELENVFLQVAKNDHQGFEYGLPIEDSATTDRSNLHDMHVPDLDVEPATPIGLWGQVLTMFRKRVIIFRRNPLFEFVTLLIPIIVAGATRTFLVSFDTPGCLPNDRQSTQKYEVVNYFAMKMVAGPQDVFSNTSKGVMRYLEGINSRDATLTPTIMESLLSNATTFVNSSNQYVDYIKSNFATLYPGGLYLESNEKPSYFSYLLNDGKKLSGTDTSVMMLNLLTNLRLNGTASIITDYSSLQVPFTSNTGNTLQFVVYFGLAMSVAPAFAGLYPTFERLHKIRSMQYSNGLRIVPLWASYTLFSFLWVLVSSVILTIIIGTASSSLLGVGYLFLTFVLYELASVLFAFVISLFVKSQLAAFAITAAIQASYFLIYLIVVLCIQTYGNALTLNKETETAVLILCAFQPVANLTKALFVLINLFGTLCQGSHMITSMGDILAYGAPIMYLVLQCVFYFGVLVWYESGKYRIKITFIHLKKRRADNENDDSTNTTPLIGVEKETAKVEENPDLFDTGLKLSHVKKVFNKKAAVDNVTFGVQEGETFALLGPNGAGKTTTFNMIRGEDTPTEGEITVNGISIKTNKSMARSRLGVCPQFDAMDKMTVVEILKLYGRLRGLKDINHHVEQIITAVGVDRFRNRIAHRLSGGNKRKLSLGIALIGNPAVLLLDEPSSGMDAFAKRIMWRTLHTVSRGKSIVLTTHSMEEADALANRAGILASRLLAIGTTDDLRQSRGIVYHLHMVCNDAPLTSQEQMLKVIKYFQSFFPNAEIEDKPLQGQIRMSVRLGDQDKLSSVFKFLETRKEELQIESYSLSRTRLEEVFLRIVGDHNVREEGYRNSGTENEQYVTPERLKRHEK